MNEVTVKQLVNTIIPNKFFVSQTMTQYNYKNDFVYRWLMYTTPMLIVYKMYLTDGVWNCNDLGKVQKVTDSNLMINFSSIVKNFITNKEIEGVEYVTITEDEIKGIIFKGSNFHAILFIFYCIYKIPALQEIIKPSCIDYDYFMSICRDKFDKFSFHYLLGKTLSKNLIELSLSFAIDYMMNEKK